MHSYWENTDMNWSLFDHKHTDKHLYKDGNGGYFDTYLN